MIGYFKKDVYLSRKMFIIAAGSFLLTLVFGLAFRFSFDYGNLKANKADGVVNCETLFVMVAGVLIMFELATIPVRCLDLDRTSGFMKLSFSTPLLEKEIITAKVLEIIAFSGIALLSVVIYGGIFGLLFGFTNVVNGMWLAMILIFLYCFFLGLAMPLSLIFKNSDLAIGTLAFMIIAGFYGFIAFSMFHPNGIMKKLEKFLQGEADITIHAFVGKYGFIITVIALALCIFGLVIAYFGSVKALERREKVCGV